MITARAFPELTAPFLKSVTDGAPGSHWLLIDHAIKGTTINVLMTSGYPTGKLYFHWHGLLTDQLVAHH